MPDNTGSLVAGFGGEPPWLWLDCVPLTVGSFAAGFAVTGALLAVVALLEDDLLSS